ncbi:DUF6932 family protein [Streptomyces coelicoflavus]|uniref:DUF6932 family protein n=1 Tax=Streptomyces coelicoflavus TaxID=285562 RepID=UPI003B98087E
MRGVVRLSTSYLPEPDLVTELLPPGRYAMSLEQMHDEFVASTGSAIRQAIWEEWTQHRAIVEAWTGEISRMWVGGSFVSRKPDPSDVDVTYLVRAEVFDRLDEEALSYLDEVTLRGWCVDHNMRVDALLLRLPRRVPVSQMVPSLLQPGEGDSYRDLGLYDEVWQCTKADSVGELPGEMRRGYVEVRL